MSKIDEKRAELRCLLKKSENLAYKAYKAKMEKQENDAAIAVCRVRISLLKEAEA